MFDGIDDGNRQNRSAALVGFENNGLDFLNRNEGPNCIVNSDDRGIRAEVLHGDRNRILTAITTLDDRDGLRETRACNELSNFVYRFLRSRNEDVDRSSGKHRTYESYK